MSPTLNDNRRLSGRGPLLVVPLLAVFGMLLTLATDSFAQGADRIAALRESVDNRTMLYQLEATVERRDALLLSRERLFEAQCFGNLARYLKFDHENMSEACKALASDISALMPNHPYPICADAGIGSPLCRQAYEYQRTIQGTYRQVSGASLLTSSAAVLPEGNSKKFKLSEETETLVEAFRETRNKETLRNLHSHYAERLREPCSKIQILFSEEEKQEIIEVQQQQQDPEDNELRSLLTDYLKEVESGKPKKKKEETSGQSDFVQNLAGSEIRRKQEEKERRRKERYSGSSKEKEDKEMVMIRARMMPAECARTLHELHWVFPLSSVYECLMKGSFHPDCVSARINEKALPESGDGKLGTSKSGSSDIAVDRF